MQTSFDDENLKKHGVSRDEVLQVFASDLSFALELEPSERGNDRAIVLGWTFGGRLLEIGIEYFDAEDREHVFHGNDAGKDYRDQMERRLKDGD